MNKYISYYRLKERSARWPQELEDKFGNNISKYGVPWFDTGSTLEEEFEQNCSEYNLEYYKNTIRKVTGESLYEYPYHYLSVSEDKVSKDSLGFFDLSNQCDGGGEIYCGTGVTQTDKITIDHSKSKLLDIMCIPSVKQLYVVSRRVKDILEGNDLTGFKLIPCIEKGKKYPDEDTKLNAYSKDIENDAKYYQLIITEHTNSKPVAGSIRKIYSQCPSCGKITAFDSSEVPYFDTNGLNKVDFQVFDEYLTSTGESIKISGEMPIISSKVLKLFIDNKIKGLASYLTDPPIKHGVVEIK